MLTLTTLTPKKRKHSRRVGRGNGSGRGTFSGRGMKGQKARSGGKGGLKLRGLRTLMKAMPKNKGFTSGYDKLKTINLSELAKRIKDNTVINLHGYKVLGVGEVTKAYTVSADAFSASAKTKLVQAGGKALKCGKH